MTDLIARSICGSGPELALIHGDFANGATTWPKQVAEPPGRLLVVDRRGYGSSRDERPAYTIAEDAADFLAAIRASNMTRPIICGHSYGGVVAIEAARQAPDLPRGLVLIEPPLFAAAASDPDAVALAREVEEVRRRADAMSDEELAIAFFTALAGDEDARRLRGGPRWAPVVAEARRFAHSEPPGAYPAEAVDELPRNLPVIVLSGDRSHPGLRAAARAIHDRLRSSRFIEVAGVGHAAQANAAAFVEAVRAILAVS
ncbi:MAG: alpha/beta hydrolase [Thermomicrobiales bacterium]|nr:alpha/beta hydrolase [Thermomicrobiales bacterium]